MANIISGATTLAILTEACSMGVATETTKISGATITPGENFCFPVSSSSSSGSPATTTLKKYKVLAILLAAVLLIPAVAAEAIPQITPVPGATTLGVPTESCYQGTATTPITLPSTPPYTVQPGQGFCFPLSSVNGIQPLPEATAGVVTMTTSSSAATKPRIGSLVLVFLLVSALLSPAVFAKSVPEVASPTLTVMPAAPKTIEVREAKTSAMTSALPFDPCYSGTANIPITLPSYTITPGEKLCFPITAVEGITPAKTVSSDKIPSSGGVRVGSPLGRQLAGLYIAGSVPLILGGIAWGWGTGLWAFGVQVICGVILLLAVLAGLKA